MDAVNPPPATLARAAAALGDGQVPSPGARHPPTTHPPPPDPPHHRNAPETNPDIHQEVAVANAIIPPRGKMRGAVKRSRTYLSIETLPAIPIRQFQDTVFAAESWGAT